MIIHGCPDCAPMMPCDRCVRSRPLPGERNWALKDLEKKHEALRAAVMTVYSDPHLTWVEARQRLGDALEELSPAPPVMP